MCPVPTAGADVTDPRPTPQPSTPSPRTFVDPDEREPQPGEAHVHHWGADGRCLFPGCSYVVERADSPSPEGARTDDHDPDYPGHDPDCPMHSPEGADRGHEHFCERCGGPNLMCWHAPSPLWNAVMRDADGLETYGVVCPRCFGELAQEKGVADFFCVTTHDPKVELASVFGDGRVWDAEQCLWVEREAALPEGQSPERPLRGEPSLDVERLAEAGGNVLDGRRIGSVRLYRNTITPDDWTAIAAEYARLGTGETE